jgi:uncharacterized protein
VHISQLSDTFVKDPAEVVKVHQRVLVTVMEVDAPRKRISLSMKSAPGDAPRRDANATGPRPAPRPAGQGQRGPGGNQPKKPQKFNSLFDALKNIK